MSVHRAKIEHESFYQDLCEILRKHGDKLSSVEMLAISSNLVGKLIALQDQRAMTPSQAMEVVATNIERGNQETIASLKGAEGGSA